MTQEEYTRGIADIDKDTRQKKNELRRTYALSNSPFNVGDIITGNTGAMIRIEKISVVLTYMSAFPTCVYSGPRLKKDKTPFKDGKYENVYLSGAVKVV